MQLRARLGEILNQASAGERIVVERDRKPLAVLISFDEADRLDESRAAVLRRFDAAAERLKALSERMAKEHPLPPGTDGVKLLHEERELRTDEIIAAARR